MDRSTTNAPSTGTANAPSTGTANAPSTGTANAPSTGTANAPSTGTANAPEEEYEEVFVPKNSKNDDSLFVSVNGKRILIKKGVKVKIPKTHAEVIKAALIQTAKNDEFIAEISTE